MPYYRTTYKSGDVLEVEEYFSPRARGKRIPRGKNQHLTTEQQAEINLRNARKKISRTINANFGKGDLFITLTYAKEPEDRTEGDRILTNYLRRLKRWRERNKMPPLKYVAVTENKDKRLHHHIVINKMDMEKAIDLWKQGRVIVSRLEPEGDYTGLANYITKESGESKGKRWKQSRNLKKPKVTVKVIDKKPRPMKPPKGYKVIQQQYYVSDVTGYMQYMRCLKIGGMDYGTGGRRE